MKMRKKPLMRNPWFWTVIVLLLAALLWNTLGGVQREAQAPEAGSASPSPAVPSSSAAAPPASGPAAPTPGSTGQTEASAVPSAMPAPSSGLPGTATDGSGGPAAAPPVSGADQIPLPKQEVEQYIRGLEGTSFIQDIEVGTDNITIAYFANYDAYKQAHPDSQTTAEAYTSFFAGGDQIYQIMMELPVRLFRQFPGTALVDLRLPFEQNTYSVSLTQGEAEQFFGTDLNEIRSDADWDSRIANQFTEQRRKEYADRFVKVEINP